MVTTKQYDLLNRLTNIVSSTNSVAIASFAYKYNNANQRTNVSLADGSYWVYTYDNLGQVTSGKKYWSDNSAVAGQQFTYAFDDIGNRTQTQVGGDNSGANLHTANYHANLLNQYTNRDVPGYVQMLGTAPTTDSILLWGNDPAIGGAATTFGAATRKGQYFWGEQSWDNSSAPRWLSLSAFATAVSGGVTNIAGASGNYYLPQTQEVFRYDADGNLTNDGRWVYTWDGENRLTRMQGMSGIPDGANLKLEFRYDGRNRRIQKEVYAWYPYYGSYQLTSRTRFAYDGWNLITELNANNPAAPTLLRSYLWGLDLSGPPQGAGGVGGLLAVIDLSTINNQPSGHFVAYDANGNVTCLINAADSTVSARYEYGPFGELLRATGPTAKANPLRFSSKYQDDETELLYYGYRYYKPSTGRWLSTDPLSISAGSEIHRSGSVDLAATQFVFNNPISRIDVLGLWPSANRFLAWFISFSTPTPLTHQNSNARTAPSWLWNRTSSLKVIDEATVEVDRHQRWDESFMHAMAAPRQGPSQAKEEANKYVSGHIKDAQKALCNCKQGTALHEFGMALHTVQDATSPEHFDFQVWYGIARPIDAAWHVFNEAFDPGPNSALDKASTWLWTFFSCDFPQVPLGFDFFANLGHDGDPLPTPPPL